MDPFLLLLIGMLIVIGGILFLRLPAFLALILGALTVGLLTPDSALEAYANHKGLQVDSFISTALGKRVGTAFGVTCGKIGILIAMASIIGICLAKSGAADRIIRSLLRLMGVKRVPGAMLLGGFTLGIPVFFDTVFYLMIPLARSMGLRNQGKYLLYILGIVAGAAMAHSLVPPTPGPLFVAGELGVNIGSMILGGIFVGLFSAGAGYLYARWSTKRWPVPLRDAEGMSLEELQKTTQKTDEELPSIWMALLPILLPILLIAGQTILSTTLGNPESLSASSQLLLSIFGFVGNSNVALTISAGLAIYVLIQQMEDRATLKDILRSALSSAGMIILITGAGGAFGQILQQTGVGIRIQDLATTYQLAVLPLAFGVTALVRAAQGSATVAMITGVGILSSMADPSVLGFHPLYLALVIGCGSKPFLWMNDSGFWIVGQMSGLTEGETLRHVSGLMTVMGFAGLVVVMILAALFPLV